MATKTGANSRFISATEVAERCGVTRNTVGSWARTGVIPAQFTPTGQVRLVRAEVEPIIERKSA